MRTAASTAESSSHRKLAASATVKARRCPCCEGPFRPGTIQESLQNHAAIVLASCRWQAWDGEPRSLDSFWVQPQPSCRGDWRPRLHSGLFMYSSTNMQNKEHQRQTSPLYVDSSGDWRHRGTAPSSGYAYLLQRHRADVLVMKSVSCSIKSFGIGHTICGLCGQSAKVGGVDFTGWSSVLS